jgi:hypothetical protein
MTTRLLESLKWVVAGCFLDRCFLDRSFLHRIAIGRGSVGTKGVVSRGTGRSSTSAERVVGRSRTWRNACSKRFLGWWGTCAEGNGSRVVIHFGLHGIVAKRVP